MTNTKTAQITHMEGVKRNTPKNKIKTIQVKEKQD
jgi:hypothetical protein